MALILLRLIIACRAPTADALRIVIYPQKRNPYWQIAKITNNKTGSTSANSTSCEPDRRLSLSEDCLPVCLFATHNAPVIRRLHDAMFFRGVQLERKKMLGWKGV
jgi:hypothetical protein